MAFDPSRLKHVSYPMATALGRVLNGPTCVADELSRAGFAGPVAIEFQRQVQAGVGNVTALHQLGFSAADATTLAAETPKAGAPFAAVFLLLMGVDPGNTAGLIAIGIDAATAAKIAANASVAAAIVATLPGH